MRECETAIRSLCHEWRDTEGFKNTKPGDLSFFTFYVWLHQNHPGCLEFESRMGVTYHVNSWFDQEIRPADPH